MKRRTRKFKRWLGRRPWSRFKFCLPALLAGLVLVVVLAMVWLIRARPAGLRYHYNRLARMSLAAGDFEVARVASLRGLSGETKERDRPEWLFYLAVAMNGLGHEQEAADLLTAAAPLDHPGYAQAHLLAAQTFLNTTNLTSEILRKAEQHLRSALALDPQSVDANELLGRLYINTHQLAKARACLFKVYAAKPETALLLAISYDLERDDTEAVKWADRAMVALRNQLIHSAPNTSPANRLGLIQALLIKGKYEGLNDPLERAMLTGTNAAPQDSPPVWLDLVRDLKHSEKYAPALETLERATRASPSPLYPAAIADICATWAGNIPSSQNAERLRLIQQGLDNASQNLKLRWLLIQAAQVPDKSGGEAKALLNESVASATGQSAAWWYFLLWTDERMKGDLPVARRHLKKAYELAPEIPQIANDLAMDQSGGSREDLERGLALIQPVIDKYPDHPGFRDTRGRILARLGRNAEAAADLQFAANRQANATETRQILARVYEALAKTHPASANNFPAVLEQTRALMKAGNYALALETLEHANRDCPSPAYPPAIADACATWAATMTSVQNAERFRLIEKGLNHDANNQKLRSLLLAAAAATDDSGAAAKTLLGQLVNAAAGETAAEWHLLLGRDALARGQPTEARQHLQMAHELAPQMTEIQSALAEALLATGNQEDLERGLGLIDSVVDRFPDSPEFRNTRGLMLARLGRNQAAAADLQYAADKLAEPRETRLALAKVYDALGKKKSAEEQRRLAGHAGHAQ